MTGSTILFALGTNFPVLLIARSLQGVGSACTATAGMALLAKVYTDEIERSRAMGIALGAIAFGDMVGPPYGGTLYHLAGKELPFLLLAVLGAIGGIIQLIVLPPKVEKNQADEEPSSMKDLLLDPYVVITLSGVFFTYLGWSAMESVMPVWLIDHFGANSIQRGLIYLPASLMYLFGINFFGPVTYKLGRWLAAFVGLLLLSVAQFAVTIMPGLYWLAIPFVMLGMMISIVDTSLYPMLSYLVEIRHQNVFGSIYAMADAMYCLSNVIGPFAAAKIVTYVGFLHTTQIAALITLLASPLMLFLRNPPVKNKKKMPKIGATVFPKSVSSKDIIHKDKDIALHEIDLK